MENTKWVIDPTHSELEFKVRHLMISNVKGQFKEFTGVIEGEDFLNSQIHASVQADSIFTNNTDRDNHLRSADFFDVDNHKEITFKSSSLEKVDDDEYKLKGELTILGVSKDVVLDVEYGGRITDPYGNDKIAFSLKGKINRKDFGLNWNTALEAGGVMVSDEVKINAELQFAKQS